MTLSAAATTLHDFQMGAIGQLVLSAAFGAVVGMERQYHGRAAGLRTHLLVSLGCCLVMIVSHSFAVQYADIYTNDQNIIRLDPARLAYSVMGGIGFLGAGAIIKSGFSIRGLTTAASIWCTASIGLAVGSKLYILGAVTTGIIMFALLVLNRAERLVGGHWYKTVQVIVNDHPDEIRSIEALLNELSTKVLDVAFERNVDDRRLTIIYNVRLKHREQTTELYQALSAHEGLHSIQVD
jgi:putative Mg2+ transporter-C (MgtC) family protein